MATSLLAAVDLGGTHFTVAMGEPDGRIVAEAKEPTRAHEGPDAVLERISRSLACLAQATRSTPTALGIGVPGLADLATGVTRFLPNMPTQWREVPVAARLEGTLGCPVYLLNDARTAALGELAFGLGREAPTFVYFTLGTGIGGAVVIEGRLRLGPLGAAGEIGHVVVDPAGPPCGCGSRGCVETIASGPALIAEAVRLTASGQSPALREACGGDFNRLDPARLGDAARAGDPAARAAIERAGEALGCAAAAAVTALDPDLIVLAGGVSPLTDLLAPAIHRILAARVRLVPLNRLRVAASPLGDRAGVLGALALAARGSSLLVSNNP